MRQFLSDFYAMGNALADPEKSSARPWQNRMKN